MLDRSSDAPAPRLYLQYPSPLDEVDLPVVGGLEVLCGPDLPEWVASGLLGSRLPELGLHVPDLVGLVPDQVLKGTGVRELSPEVDAERGDCLVEDDGCLVLVEYRVELGSCLEDLRPADCYILVNLLRGVPPALHYLTLNGQR